MNDTFTDCQKAKKIVDERWSNKATNGCSTFSETAMVDKVIKVIEGFPGGEFFLHGLDEEYEGFKASLAKALSKETL